MGSVSGLVKACHPEPTAAVTAVAAALAASAGRGVAGTLAVASAVLAGQLSVGWMNDYLDRDRDVRVHRADKPVVAGALTPHALRAATIAAGVAMAPLSLLSGFLAGSLHIVAVLSAWSYNLRLKSSALSVLPYAVSFGLLPAFITAGLPGHPVLGWLVAAGALLGAGAHFANVLPDIADDLSTGVRGLPHRIGATGSRVAAAVLLTAASVVLAAGPPGPPGVLGIGAVIVAVVCGVGAGVLGRRPGSRAAFLGVLVVAAVDVALLVGSGSALR